MKSYKKTSLLVLKILVAAICLWLVGRAQDWGEIKKIFSNLDLFYFFVAVLFFTLGQLIVMLRWNYLLRVQSVRISNFTAIKLGMLGLFYNNFLPSAIGGDFLRAWYVTKHTDQEHRLAAAFSVFFDRALGLFGMFVLAMIGYFLVIYGREFKIFGDQKQDYSGYLPTIYILLSVALGLAVVVGLTRKGRKVTRIVLEKAVSIIKRVVYSVRIYAKRPFSMLFALGLTYISQLISIVGLWLLGSNLGIDVSFKYYLVFFPLSWVVGAIPISIGGIGVIEGLLTILFVAAGADTEAAFSLSLCQRAILLIVALPGICVHLAGAHLPGEEFFVDSNESIV